MNLSDFILNTLLSIGNGVTQANKACRDSPFTFGGAEANTIDFEVYITVSNKNDLNGKANAEGNILSLIKVAATAGLSKERKEEEKHLVKFKVKSAERADFEILQGAIHNE